MRTYFKLYYLISSDIMVQKLQEKLPEEFVSKTVIYDYKTPATQVLSNIHSLGAIVVEKDKEYYGIVDSRSLARNSQLKLSSSVPIGKFAEHVPILNNSTSIDAAVLHFYNTSKKALPYTAGKKKVTGIIRREKILSSILSRHMVSSYLVNDGISSPVVAVDENATVAQATKAMEEHKINKLVVLSKGVVMGVLTRRDLLATKSAPAQRAPEKKEKNVLASNTPVGSICEDNVYSIECSKLMDSAIRSMLENSVSSLLVTDKGKPVGVISMRNVFEKVLANSQVKENKILLSGLEGYTKDFEDEIMKDMNDLVEKISKFHKIDIDYLSVNIKRPRSKNYEIRARLVSNKKGTFSVGASGYSLEEAIKNISDRLYNQVKEKKEVIVTGSRERDAEDYE